jgi:threonine dehydratase
MLSTHLIEQATRFLAGRIRITPVEPSPLLGEVLGCRAFLKLESLQVTGSFKVRGALFRLASLTEDERRKGVATCSAGNHGKAVAYAAQQMGIRATVYVPRTVDAAKLAGMRALGAEVVLSAFDGFDDTQAWAIEQAGARGLPFVSAFEDDAVMAGNGGSLAAEVLGQMPGLRTAIVPVGGGGLAAGFAFHAKSLVPDLRIVCCQHRDSPGLALSLERGWAVTRIDPIDTVAGGLEGGIGVSNFEILRTRVDDVVLVDEDEIRAATLWLLEHHQYLVEPSGAATVAACLSGRIAGLRGDTAVVLTGRNVGIGTLRRMLTRVR